MLFSSSKLLLSFLFIGSCIADDPPVRVQVTQINNDIAYIARTLTYLDGYIKAFNPANATNLDTMNIYNFAFEVIDDTQNAKTSVDLFSRFTDDKFYANEAQTIASTVDGLAPTLGSVLTGFKDKKDDFAAVGIDGSSETLISRYKSVLTNSKEVTGQLYSLITRLSPEPTKQHFQELSTTFADEFDTAIAAYSTA